MSERRTPYKSSRAITVVEKRCSRCRETKPASEFRPNHRMKSGLDTYCRPCNTEKGREWRSANPGRSKELEQARRPRTTMERRKIGLWVNFRMGWEDYVAMLDSQGGVCAICGTPEPGTKSGTFVVDHDHACCAGVKSCGWCVRGLLCGACNMALGHMKDDADRLLSAARYLSQGRTP